MSKEMEIRIRPIFSTPLLVFTVPDQALLHNALRRAVLLHDAGKSIAFTPTAGQCVLFPGWLSHAVGVYNGSAPRVSVAFNLDPIIEEFKDWRFNAPPKK